MGVGLPAGMTLGVALLVLGAGTLFFGAGTARAQAQCLSDLDLFADVAERFLLQQELSAIICDPVLVARGKKAKVPMLTLSRDIVDKYYAQILSYAENREKRFRAEHGENWRLVMEAERKRDAEAFLRTLKLGAGACATLRREIEIVFESDWEYIHAKIDFAFTEARPAVKRCE